jgi:hypothetical protein
MALGSTPGQIFQLVIGDGLRLTAIGVIIALGAGVAFARVLSIPTMWVFLAWLWWRAGDCAVLRRRKALKIVTIAGPGSQLL